MDKKSLPEQILMTKITFGKKLLMLATITVLVTGLTMSASFDDAEAKKAKTGEHKLKCKSIGSWFNQGPTDPVFSSTEGKCSAGLSKVTSAAITAVDPIPTLGGCLTLSSATGLPSFSMGKKGFIEYTTTSVQCLFDETDQAIDLNTTPPNWCNPGGAHTSTVTGTYEITDGLVKDKPVVGGSGTFVSEANHCDDEAPYGNSFTTKLEGTIVFPG
jgi:hypothetical protein